MTPEQQAFCRGCIHYSTDPSCDYILHTGHRRGCPVGENCIRRETGSKKRVLLPVVMPHVDRRKFNGRPHSFDTQEARRKFEAGWTDEQLAAWAGITVSGISAWRKRNRLFRKRGGSGAPRRQGERRLTADE